MISLSTILESSEKIWEKFGDASGKYSKRTIMAPLHWLVGIFFLGTSMLIRVDAPEWLSTTCGIFLFIAVLVYIIVFLHAYFTNPEKLRTEEYRIKKSIIENHFKGDSLTGEIGPSEIKSIEAEVLSENEGSGS